MISLFCEPWSRKCLHTESKKTPGSPMLVRSSGKSVFDANAKNISKREIQEVQNVAQARGNTIKSQS